MSKIALTPNVSGTGVFTIASPNSNTDRVITLPDEAGTVLTSASDVAASQITDALNATGSAPIYACRAWVNFNGTGTVAIRASGNVSSITDNGTGDYTVNFTTAMPDANYCVAGTAGRDNQNCLFNLKEDNLALGSGSVRVMTVSSTNNTPLDSDFVTVAVFR